jgi:hypothetical protein
LPFARLEVENAELRKKFAEIEARNAELKARIAKFGRCAIAKRNS